MAMGKNPAARQPSPHPETLQYVGHGRGRAIVAGVYLMHPLILQASDHAENLSIHPLFHEHVSERLHQRTNPVLRTSLRFDFHGALNMDTSHRPGNQGFDGPVGYRREM